MPTFCMEGETARVTLPDSTIMNFTDTPIDITIKNVYATLNKLITIEIGFVYSPSEIRYRYRQLIFPANLLDVGRLDGETFIPLPFFLDYGDFTGKLDDSSFIYLGTTFAAYYFIGFRVYDHSINQWIEPSYALEIKNSQGEILFSDSYDNPNYTVECLQGCPPNTIDCGDCCLPCDDVLQKLCDILRIFEG